MKIICVYGHMFNVNTWARACETLGDDGINLVLFSQMKSAGKVVEYMDSFGADLFIGQLFKELGRQGFIPLCVISEGTQDAGLPLKDRYPWLAYLTAPKEEDQPRALVNLMAGRLPAAPSDTTILENLGIPGGPALPANPGGLGKGCGRQPCGIIFHGLRPVPAGDGRGH